MAVYLIVGRSAHVLPRGGRGQMGGGGGKMGRKRGGGKRVGQNRGHFRGGAHTGFNSNPKTLTPLTNPPNPNPLTPNLNYIPNPLILTPKIGRFIISREERARPPLPPEALGLCTALSAQCIIYWELGCVSDIICISVSRYRPN